MSSPNDPRPVRVQLMGKGYSLEESLMILFPGTIVGLFILLGTVALFVECICRRFEWTNPLK